MGRAPAGEQETRGDLRILTESLANKRERVRGIAHRQVILCRFGGHFRIARFGGDGGLQRLILQLQVVRFLISGRQIQPVTTVIGIECDGSAKI